MKGEFDFVLPGSVGLN